MNLVRTEKNRRLTRRKTVRHFLTSPTVHLSLACALASFSLRLSAPFARVRFLSSSPCLSPSLIHALFLSVSSSHLISSSFSPVHPCLFYSCALAPFQPFLFLFITTLLSLLSSHFFLQIRTDSFFLFSLPQHSFSLVIALYCLFLLPCSIFPPSYSTYTLFPLSLYASSPPFPCPHLFPSPPDSFCPSLYLFISRTLHSFPPSHKHLHSVPSLSLSMLPLHPSHAPYSLHLQILSIPHCTSSFLVLSSLFLHRTRTQSLLLLSHTCFLSRARPPLRLPRSFPSSTPVPRFPEYSFHWRDSTLPVTPERKMKLPRRGRGNARHDFRAEDAGACPLVRTLVSARQVNIVPRRCSLFTGRRRYLLVPETHEIEGDTLYVSRKSQYPGVLLPPNVSLVCTRSGLRVPKAKRNSDKIT